MAVEKSVFGTTSQGQEATLYTLRNQNGMEAAVTNYGAILVKLLVPDARGVAEDVVLGFDSVNGYEGNPSFFGAVIGPSANRIGGAAFSLNGVTYQLDVNDNDNNLHSHIDLGYHKQLWTEAELCEDAVTFSLEDPDGSMGFPGNKRVQVTYRLDEENGLTLHYHGSSDQLTILNLTNHTYFNLDGHDSGSIGDHLLQLHATMYTPTLPGSIPTGEIAPVAGTPMDFTQMKPIGKEIDEAFEQLTLAGGYDHNWVLDEWDGSLRPFAVAKGSKSGRVMKASTTLPGVQFYAGNFIVDQTGKDGVGYGKRTGFCLETQYFPDAIHHENFPGCVFGGEKEYDSVTVYRFEKVAR